MKSQSKIAILILLQLCLTGIKVEARSLRTIIEDHNEPIIDENGEPYVGKTYTIKSVPGEISYLDANDLFGDEFEEEET